MWLLQAVGASLAVVFGLFWFLQWLSNRTYKPSREEIRGILTASMEGRLDLGTFDRFSCVRIAYDARLDRIRERFNEIVDNIAHTEGEITEQNATPLNEVGRARLRELLNELGRDSI